MSLEALLLLLTFLYINILIISYIKFIKNLIYSKPNYILAT